MRLPPETVPALLAAAVHRTPEAPALRAPARDGGGATSWSELGELVRHVALGLIADGLEPGDRVVVTGADGLAWRVADLAVLAAGGVSVTRAAPASADRPGGGRGRVAGVAGRSAGPARELDAGDRPAGVAALAALRERGRALDGAEPDRFERSWRAVDPDADAAVVPVSDDGELVFSHRALVWAVRSLAQVAGVGPGSRVLATVPPTRAVGRTTTHLLALLNGGTAWLTAEVTADDVAAFGPHVVVGDRALWEDVARRVAGHDPGRVRRMLLERHRRSLPVASDDLGPAGRLERRAVTRWLVPAVAADAGLAGAVAVSLEPLPEPLLRALAGHGVLVRLAHADERAAAILAIQPESGIGAGTAGPPAPGVSVRVDGDGVAVRAGSVARGVADDRGWFALPGAGLEGGRLVVAGGAPAP